MTHMAPHLPALTFHSLDRKPSGTSFAPELFNLLLQNLYKSGYTTIYLEELVTCLRNKKEFPDKSLLITFDDGCHSIFEQGFPVLQRFNMTAIVFLTVNYNKTKPLSGRLPTIEGRTMLTWSHIKEMHKYGIEFGAHTLTHRDLTRLPQSEIEEEILKSKSIIEDALGTEVLCFAYPFGKINDASYEIVRENFSSAFTDRLGLITTNSPRHALNRVDAYYLHSERLCSILPSSLFPWYVKVLSVPRKLKRMVLS